MLANLVIAAAADLRDHLATWLTVAVDALPLRHEAPGSSRIELDARRTMGAAGGRAEALTEELRAWKLDTAWNVEVWLERSLFGSTIDVVVRGRSEPGSTVTVEPREESFVPVPEPAAVPVDLEVLPATLVKGLKALRAWHALGHTESCCCRPCAALRATLVERGILDLVYREPRRTGLRAPAGPPVPEERPFEDFFDGWRCAHGVDFESDCRACGLPT